MGRLRRFRGAHDATSALDARFKLPAHAIYLHWRFATEDLHTLEFDLTIHSDPGPEVGSYFAPFSGAIGDAQAYGGIQTDLYQPGVGGIGKGALFSTWWSFDAADTYTAPDGFIQLGTHEGRFVGVRRAVAWTVGHWRFAFTRLDGTPGSPGSGMDPVGDWYECTIAPLAGDTVAGERPALGGDVVFLGAMRFPRPGGRRAAIGRSFPSFLEVYNGASTYAEIADWHIDVMAYGNGMRADGLRTEYPAFPYAEVPNADAWFDPIRGRAHVRFGNETVREHAPATIF